MIDFRHDDIIRRWLTKETGCRESKVFEVWRCEGFCLDYDKGVYGPKSLEMDRLSGVESGTVLGCVPDLYILLKSVRELGFRMKFDNTETSTMVTNLSGEHKMYFYKFIGV